MSTSVIPALINKRYVLHEQIGRGGMGVVYKAFDRLTRQYVALKQVTVGEDSLIFSSRDTSADLRLSLSREFQTLASLRHPNIVSVLDYGFDAQKQPFFTMELLQSTQTILLAGRSKNRDVQVGLIIQLLQSLAYLHRRDIRHRDLKPSNVLVVDQIVKVLDFGLSVNGTQAGGDMGSTGGTIPYMSPEALMGNASSSTPVSDLYAVGMIAYELLMGTYPFRTNSTTDLIHDIINTKPVMNGGIDRRVVAVIERLLAKKAEDRFQSAQDAIIELNKALITPLSLESISIIESFLQSAQFVGRDTELNQLITVFQDAKEGHGAAWLIGGESGVGKSRLLSELRARALVQGALVLQGQAVSDGGALYQVWQNVLRWLALFSDLTDLEAGVLKELIPDLPQLVDRAIPDAPPVDPQATQSRILSVIEGLFTRQKEPLLVILEDIHWADSESLGVLKHLTELSATLPILFIGSYRDDERHDLPDQLPEMRRMKLSRLTEEGIKALSVSMLGEAGRQKEVIDLLQVETEGNVFFLVEVVRALAEIAGRLTNVSTMTLPRHVFAGGVQTVIKRRLDRISSTDQTWLQLAAVSGRQLDLPMLRESGLDAGLEQWLTQCNEAAVIESIGENQWRFTHDKLREGVLKDISVVYRRGLHQQVGHAMEKAYPNSTAQTPALAYHFSQAENWEKASTYLIQAADNANRLYAHGEARKLYTQALDALKKLPVSDSVNRQLADVTAKLVSITYSSESPDHNLALLSEAEKLATALPDNQDRRLLARVHYWMGRSYYYKAETRTAIGYFQKVLATAKEFGDHELMIIPASVIGQALIIQGQYGKAQGMLGMAVSPLEKAANWPEWIRAVTFYGYALAANGKVHEGEKETLRGLQKAEESQFLTGIGTGNLMLWLVHFMGNMPATMQAEAEKVISTAEQSGDMLYRYFGIGFKALTESRAGKHTEATHSLAQLEEAAGQIKGQLVLSDFFSFVTAEAALNAGRINEAVVLGEKAATYCKAISTYTEGLSQRVWGMALAAQGESDWETIDSHMSASATGLEASSAILEAARTRRAWGTLAKQHSKPEIAREQLTAALAQFAASDLPHEVEATRKLLEGL